FQAEDGIRDRTVTGVQTCALPISIGATTETVTVSAENSGVQVNTQDSSLGNTIVSTQIAQLPMEARNVLALLSLQPGVTKDGYRSEERRVGKEGRVRVGERSEEE